jgi:hypothetical protein
MPKERIARQSRESVVARCLLFFILILVNSENFRDRDLYACIDLESIRRGGKFETETLPFSGGLSVNPGELQPIVP